MKIPNSKFQIPNKFQNSKFKIQKFDYVKDSFGMDNLKFKILRFAFCILHLIIAFCILHLSEAKAQTLSLSIWPPLLEVTIQPGKSITQVYKLRNTGETDLALTSKIVPFKPEGETGDINLEFARPPARQGTWNSEFLPWFSFLNADLSLGQKFFLPAGREQEVVLKIKVPAEAPETDYYFTLLFETLPEVFLPSGSGGQIEAKIGSNILLTASQTGEPKKQAKIEEFSIRNSQFVIRNLIIIDSFTQPQFVVRLKNTGNAFFKPFGSITTAGWFNQRWVLDLLPENVLVNSVRQIRCQKSASLTTSEENTPSEKQSVLPSPCHLETKFLLGKYSAKLEFGLDEASGEYQKEIVFWAVPLKLAAGILVSLVLLFVIATKLPALRK
jgi:hypothetical protein